MGLSTQTKSDIYACLMTSGQSYRLLELNPSLSPEIGIAQANHKCKLMLASEVKKYFRSDWIANKTDCNAVIDEIVIDWLTAYYEQDLDGYTNLLTKEIAYTVMNNPIIRDEMIKLCDRVSARLETLRQSPQFLKSDNIPDSIYRCLVACLNNSQGIGYLNSLRAIPINWLAESIDFNQLDSEIWDTYRMIKELDD
jgi:hypothetical protein